MHETFGSEMRTSAGSYAATETAETIAARQHGVPGSSNHTNTARAEANSSRRYRIGSRSEE
ncbi:hypothetical protein B1T45_10655 [Mycobacterium kansasii]|nr:hypothetical protein B1T43_10590 [Mycobacterium kansasii]ARG61683.1 hypothetical protein B1T45_10655 [Mycobacterium kansasii]ARG69370.1 hypothetical protein B1T47_10290 [Mycobacterium kansasii]ARG76007.1 hypothetical protein B1T51_17780 [Mycobacterium kansasii]ARG81543.1 hypothetical protein B1T52_18230 [Mycobacterium kansasii]